MGQIEERAGLILSIITSILFCGAAFGIAQSQITHNTDTIKELEADRRVIWEVKKDVEWIRSRMSRDERLGLSPRFGPVPGNNPPKGAR